MKNLKEHDMLVSSQDKEFGDKAKDGAKESSSSVVHPPPIAKPIARPNSAKTWHTWRDQNTSYAYTDVKKYIEENDLMSPAKDARIRSWAQEVDRHMAGIMDSGELPILGAAASSTQTDDNMSVDVTTSESSR